MTRTIIVGDVHGCLIELEGLLRQIRVRARDRLYFVGDLVGRGPDTVGVLNLVDKIGGISVRGNHEQKLLAHSSARAEGLPPPKIHRLLAEAALRSTPSHWRLIQTMPLWLELPAHGLCIVHAGLVPGRPMTAQEPRNMLTIRGLTDTGCPTDRRDAKPWSKSYIGPPHVVFGHNALPEPQIETWSTGIDTGCVYGGSLSAMVLSDHQPVPPVARRSEVLVSYPAHKAYCAIRATDTGK